MSLAPAARAALWNSSTALRSVRRVVSWVSASRGGRDEEEDGTFGLEADVDRDGGLLGGVLRDPEVRAVHAEAAGVVVGLDELLEADGLEGREVPVYHLLVDAGGDVEADVVDGHVGRLVRMRVGCGMD